MTFRPSVLPDRDNDILSTFIRSFERARQLRRADQAESRAQAEFEARQEDREARREEQLFQTRLQVATDPSLTTLQDPTTRAIRQQVGRVSPAGGPDIARALSAVAEEARPRLGVIPGTEEEVFFDPMGRERALRQAAELERELEPPDPEMTAEARAQRRAALSAAGVPEEELPILERDPEAARQRLQSLSAERARRETAEIAREGATTGGERERQETIEAIKDQFESIGRPITDAQAAIFEANPRMMEDAMRPIPRARQEAIVEDLDRMQDILDDIESAELSSSEKLTRKRRALIDGGFMGPAEDFGTGLRRFQESRQEMRDMAGTFLQPDQGPDPDNGPAEESGLGENQPARTINPANIPAAAAAIEDLNFADRNAELDRVFPGLSATDRAAIMREAGPAPIISGDPAAGTEVGAERGVVPVEEETPAGGQTLSQRRRPR